MSLADDSAMLGAHSAFAAGVNSGATGWDSTTMQHYGDRIKLNIAPVHTKDRNPIMADWIS